MAKAKIEKITLSRARDIPFDKLVLSSRNVRRLRAGVSIEDLAGDIARRTLLQSLSVRAVSAISRRVTRTCPRRSSGVSPRSRRNSMPSRTGPSATIPAKSPAPAPSSPSTATAG